MKLIKIAICLLICLCISFLVLPSSIQAAESAVKGKDSVDWWESGGISPLKDTTDIVMLKAETNIDAYLNYAVVKSTFYLKNKGKTQTILVGYPDIQKTRNTMTNCSEGSSPSFCCCDPYPGPQNNLKIWVDDHPQQITTKKQESSFRGDCCNIYKSDINETVCIGVDTPTSIVVWDAWPVTFIKDKVTVIKSYYWVDYRPRMVLWDDFERSYTYYWSAGYNWGGKAINAKFYVNFKDGITVNEIKGYSKGIRKLSYTRALWDIANLKPKDHVAFGFTFKKNAYRILRTRYLTGTDLKMYDLDQLKRLHDSIYAYHGKINKEYDIVFSEELWFKKNPKYSYKLLNKYERKNLQILNKHIKELDEKARAGLK